MDYADSPETKGMIKIDYLSRKAAVLQLWGNIKCAINTCSEKMKLILLRFRVSKDLSVFSEKF